MGHGDHGRWVGMIYSSRSAHLHENRRPLRSRRIHLGARFNEHFDGGQRAVARRQHQRRRTTRVVGRIHTRLVGYEQLAHVGEVARRRMHEDALAAPVYSVGEAHGLGAAHASEDGSRRLEVVAEHSTQQLAS